MSLLSSIPSKLYSAKRLPVGMSPVIGGGCDDACWSAAYVLTDFSFPWTDRRPPLTEFRALWDSEILYLRFDVTDTDVVLSGGASALEKVAGSDRVEIFFTPGPELNPYYALEMDPRGEVLSYEAKYHRQMNWSWSCDGLVVEASLTGRGYTVEASIPISTLRKLRCLHQGKDADYLIAGLYRAEFRHAPDGGPIIEDWISWVDPNVPTPDFHVPSSFGVIQLNYASPT